MSLLFITGAGTDIGKTYVTAALCRATGRRAIKPAISGVGPIDQAAFAASDTAILLAAQGLPLTAGTVDACSPWRFAAPLAADQAARLEGRALTLAELVAFVRSAGDDLMVEGAGGVMSPICEDATVLDWIVALGCPALLVAGSYLGGISHALTSVEAMKARGVVLAGVVVNESAGGVDLEETRRAIARFLPGVAVVTLARDALAGPELVALSR